MALEQEMEHFNKIRDSLLGSAKGDYALIHEDKLVGTFKSKEDAIKKGHAEFGNKAFLVKRIVEFEETVHFTSGYLSQCFG